MDRKRHFFFCVDQKGRIWARAPERRCLLLLSCAGYAAYEGSSFVAPQLQTAAKRNGSVQFSSGCAACFVHNQGGLFILSASSHCFQAASPPLLFPFCPYSPWLCSFALLLTPSFPPLYEVLRLFQSALPLCAPPPIQVLGPASLINRVRCLCGTPLLLG